MKIAIGLPAYRSVIHVLQADMWMRLGEECAKRDVEIVYTQPTDVCEVAIARNNLMRGALEDQNTPDWLFSIDSDNVVVSQNGKTSGELILGMLEVGDGHPSVAAIGAPCFKRGKEQQEHMLLNVRNMVADDWRPLSVEDIGGKVCPVHRMGTGVIAYRMSWIREFWRRGPWFQFVFPPEAGGERWIGEDDWFCDEARKRGGIIMCDGRFIAAHSNARTE